jgi:hypothetical protein
MNTELVPRIVRCVKRECGRPRISRIGPTSRHAQLLAHFMPREAKKSEFRKWPLGAFLRRSIQTTPCVFVHNSRCAKSSAVDYPVSRTAERRARVSQNSRFSSILDRLSLFLDAPTRSSRPSQERKLHCSYNSTHFRDFPFDRLRSRTPRPPPSSSMKSIPAVVIAARIFLAVCSRPPSSPSTDSRRATVGSETPDFSAKSACDQPSSARAALT